MRNQKVFSLLVRIAVSAAAVITIGTSVLLIVYIFVKGIPYRNTGAGEFRVNTGAG